MVQQIQLIQVTPEELQQAILSGVKQQLESLAQNFQPKEPTQYLTRNEVADLLKVNLCTISIWTKKRKLRSYGIGSRVYYKRHEIEQSLIPLNE
ncbi:helix-turn-helix domain-containing protein [uncultured Sunxiuqinia sp.]|uniref:helix-turn-helix domain-containing protein n=1 Tax=uncultured Sunxiuqinia sp. TaxID=1573825 RepID=UPI002607F26E|nr:helix-turn-helix domain-containing protein [uncultured Sunxiuqinia sp.]